MEILNENNLLADGQINEDNKKELSGIAQWANLAAIISFAGLAISLVKIFVDMSKISNEFGGNIGLGASMFGFVLTAGVTLLINITLFNAAKYVKLGVDQTDQGYFAMGIQKLGLYFKILGIIFIVGLVITAIAVLFGLVMGVASSRF